MSLERTVELRSPHAARRLLSVVGLAGAIGCTTYPTLKAAVPLDCSVEDPYEFQLPMIDNFETVTIPGMAPDGWFVSGDSLGIPTVDVEALADGTRCGSTAALVFKSQAGHTNNDWGSIVGKYSFGTAGVHDESMYEGLSFWARAPGNTSKSFTILLGDANTSCGGTPSPDGGACSEPPGAYCRTYSTDGGNALPQGTYIDPMTGMAISGTTMQAPPPDACGNAYFVVATVTPGWQLYTVPFGKFQQGSMPNRVPNDVFTMVGSVPGTTLLTTKLESFTIRYPREATVELWIDNLTFYRKKGSATGSDGGSDAR